MSAHRGWTPWIRKTLQRLFPNALTNVRSDQRENVFAEFRDRNDPRIAIKKIAELKYKGERLTPEMALDEFDPEQLGLVEFKNRADARKAVSKFERQPLPRWKKVELARTNFEITAGTKVLRTQKSERRKIYLASPAVQSHHYSGNGASFSGKTPSTTAPLSYAARVSLQYDRTPKAVHQPPKPAYPAYSKPPAQEKSPPLQPPAQSAPVQLAGGGSQIVNQRPPVQMQRGQMADPAGHPLKAPPAQKGQNPPAPAGALPLGHQLGPHLGPLGPHIHIHPTPANDPPPVVSHAELESKSPLNPATPLVPLRPAHPPSPKHQLLTSTPQTDPPMGPAHSLVSSLLQPAAPDEPPALDAVEPTAMLTPPARPSDTRDDDDELLLAASSLRVEQDKSDQIDRPLDRLAERTEAHFDPSALLPQGLLGGRRQEPVDDEELLAGPSPGHWELKAAAMQDPHAAMQDAMPDRSQDMVRSGHSAPVSLQKTETPLNLKYTQQVSVGVNHARLNYPQQAYIPQQPLRQAQAWNSTYGAQQVPVHLGVQYQPSWDPARGAVPTHYHQ